MTGEIVARLLSQVVHILSASAFWCAVAQAMDARFGVVQTSLAAAHMRHIRAAGEETVAVSQVGNCGQRTICREIEQVAPGGEGTKAEIRMPLVPVTTVTGQRESDGLVVTAQGWWYVTLDYRDGRVATTFVKSDGSRATHPRPPAEGEFEGGVVANLIAVAGEEPRALEFTALNAEAPIMLVREVDWSGASRSWRLPSMNLWPHLTAERLPDGKIALFSADAGLTMYLLSGDGNVATIVLRNLSIRQFATAIDRAGRIAIAAARKDPDLIEVAVIDPANPDKAEWYPLRRDARVTGYNRELQIVARQSGFVVAWINDSDKGRIEAMELDARGHGGPVIEIGQALSARGGYAAFFDIQATQDEMLFWWDDGRHLVERRLPASLAGYAFVHELTQHSCETDAAR